MEKNKFAIVYLGTIQAKASPLAQVVYLYLSRYANINKECWPSISLLSKDTLSSSRSVIRALHELCKIGAIEIKKSNGSKNFYRLIIRDLSKNHQKMNEETACG